MNQILSITILLSSLYEAITRDDVDRVINFGSADPELLHLAAREWQESPLLLACRSGSHLVAEHIARRFPGSVRVRSKREGWSPLHIACQRGDLPMVELLVEIEPRMCLSKDRSLMVPLQTAVVNGHAHVLKPLIAACPGSARRTTSNRETVFHLAVKNCHWDVFEALADDINEPDRRNLLHKKDGEGNNVLHIAASDKLVRVVEKLILSTSGALVRVNSLNRTGKTALDICHGSSWDAETGNIRNILYNAGALPGSSLPHRARLRWSYDTKNIVLVVLTMVLGAVFTSICNLPSSFLLYILPQDAKFHLQDLFQWNLPEVFYLLVADTATVVVCLGATMVLTWSIRFRAIMLYVTVALGIVYSILVNKVVPKFWVCLGSDDRKIHSSVLVWVLAGAFVGLGVLGYLVLMGLSLFGRWISLRARLYCYHIAYVLNPRNRRICYTSGVRTWVTSSNLQPSMV